MHRKMDSLLPLLLLVALTGYAQTVGATTYSLLRSYSYPATVSLGRSVAAVGDTIVGGATYQANTEEGAVYAFDRATGALLRRLGPPQPAKDFGISVAALGSDLLVGASYANAAFLFDGTTGALIRQFTNPGPNDPTFGLAVAADGSNVLVAARVSQAVSLFDGTTGDLLRTISTGVYAIAAMAGKVLVGDPFTSPNGTGAAYVFDEATGALLRTFVSPAPQTNEYFGGAVAWGGGNVVIGAPGNNVGAGDSGAAYVFDGTTGALLHTFLNPVPVHYAFGLAVAALGNDVLVGGSYADASPGAVYLFDAASGMLVQTLDSPHPTAGDRFGFSLATAGSDFVVGSPDTPALHLFDACGNGVIAPLEQCDDGNLADGDGCSSTCKLELCGPAPATGCRKPASSKSSIIFSENAGSRRNAMVWKWNRGAATDLMAFGDPVNGTSYALCVYDASGASQPLLELGAPGGQTCSSVPCWRAMNGFSYRDNRLTPSGISTIRLVPGVDGKARISLVGRGANLGLPPLPLTPTVTVQLRNTSTNVCWEATFSTAALNSSTKFVARSD